MKGWKTIGFAIALVVMGAAQSVAEIIPMDESTSGIVFMVIGGITAALRAVTSTPLGSDS